MKQQTKRFLKLLFLSILFLPLSYVFSFIFFIKTPHISEETLHVFLESYATNPALSQMILFVQLPEKSPKIIAWHRFPKRSRLVDLKKYNTEEVNLSPKEGLYVQSTKLVLNRVLEKLENNPLLTVELHFSMFATDTTIRPFLAFIPRHKIKRIHFYEDGYGEFFKNGLYFKNNLKEYKKEEVISALFLQEGWDRLMTFSFNKLYPVTYHVFDGKRIKDNPSFSKLDIQDIDFLKLSKTLTDNQKQLFYKLVGFDYDYYKKLMTSKKSIVFLMGFHSQPFEEFNSLVKTRKDKNFMGINESDYIWFYKPHPSFSAPKTTQKEIEKYFPDMIEIPSQIPFELFVLSDLKPTYLFGFSSSAFYSFPKENILFFIAREKNDNYMNYMKDIIHLSEERFFLLSDFPDRPPLKDKRSLFSRIADFF